jgi:hypothetical protein
MGETILREGQQGGFESAAHGHRPKWFGYLTGAIHVDSILKVLTSRENRASLANSERAVAYGRVRSITMKSDPAWVKEG